jgi:hypothetical protein
LKSRKRQVKQFPAVFRKNYQLKKQMKEILQTTLLEYEKSTFLIDLIKHDNQKLYIQVVQTMQHKDEPATQHVLKINPSVLKDIVNVLDNYSHLIQNPKTIPVSKNNPVKKSNFKKFLTEKDKTELQKRYLKGVSIRDLTIQFDCNAELIQQVLRNKGIAIVDNEIPKFYFKKNFWRKKK